MDHYIFGTLSKDSPIVIPPCALRCPVTDLADGVPPSDFSATVANSGSLGILP